MNRKLILRCSIIFILNALAIIFLLNNYFYNVKSLNRSYILIVYLIMNFFVCTYILYKIINSFNELRKEFLNLQKNYLQKENRLQSLINNIDNAIIAVDKDFKVIMINNNAQTIFGINQDKIGKEIKECLENKQLYNSIIYAGRQYKQIKINSPNERELKIKIADIINENNIEGKILVVQDVTNINRIENIRSQFVANVSHELKTPLTSIKGFAETLKMVEDCSTRNKFLDIINDEAERLTRLISDILVLSDIEHKKEIKKEVIDIQQIVNEVYNLMKNISDKKQLQLNLIEDDTPNIIGDRDKFKQMLINLVDNAIKYTEKGSVTIGYKTCEDKLNIWVKDTGVGISKEQIPRLFERFYRVDKARSRAQGGTGLGLAIVKHIVITFNGTINVESKFSKGSKFTITIPFNYI